ncbi:MAG: 30S ribosomal protein S13 [Candidatus Nanoarchaeia archaeon]
MAEFRHIVRICNTDVKGEKSILFALIKIKGVNVMYANMALSVAGVDKAKKAGELSESEVNKIDEILRNPSKYHVPKWLLNRRKDYETGDDKHLLGSDLSLEKDNDLKRMKKVKTYRGLRHQWGLTVRGQRTKSNFRRNKGKGLVAKKKTVLRK